MTPALRTMESTLAPAEDFLEFYETQRSSFPQRFRTTFYTGFVVTLYGALEKFVEDISEWLVDQYSAAGTCATQELKDVVLAQHFERTINVLSLERNRRHIRNFDRNRTIKSLYDVSLNGVSALSGAPFRTHSSNFRWDSLVTHLGAVGLDPRKDLNNSNLESRLSCKKEDIINLLEISLRELVEARNICSHGVLTNMEPVENLRKWLLTTKVLAQWIDRIAASSAAESFLHKLRQFEVNATEVLSSGQIVVLTGEIGVINVGDILVSKRQRNPTLCWAPIESLQINDHTLQSAHIFRGNEVGVKTRSRRKKKHSFFIVPRGEWDSTNLPEDDS